MKRIYFTDNNHSYADESGVPYISVSGVAGRLHSEKNWDEIKERYAEKNGLTVEEVTEEWETKKEIGTLVGTLIHESKEKELINTINPRFKGIQHSIIQCPIKGERKESIDISKLKNNTCYPEIILFSEEYKVAGQADVVYITDRYVHLRDYKTDKSIDFSAFSSSTCFPDTLKAPVSHLEDCNYNLYSLKMSMYMWMILQANPKLKFGSITLEHLELKRDEDGTATIIDDFPVILNQKNYGVRYLKKEVEAVLNNYRNEIN